MRLVLLSLFSLLPWTLNGREITTDLKAPWNQRSIDPILEIGEFISTHSMESFWNYVTDLCSSSDMIDQALQNQTMDMKLNIQHISQISGQKVLPQNIHSLMKAAQKLEMYAPTTVFYESITSSIPSSSSILTSSAPCGDGQSYLLLYPHQQMLCDLPTEDHFSMTQERINEDSYIAKWDYRYPASSSMDTSTLPIVVLHGIPGTSSFCSLHQSLSHLSDSKLINYVFRPAFPGVPTLATSRPLQGYGVYLDIKNMEYKNVDDKDERDKNQDATTTDDVIQFEKGEEVKGVIFSTLQERKPELSKEFSILREEILAEDALNADGVTEMKVCFLSSIHFSCFDPLSPTPPRLSLSFPIFPQVWKMMDLGLQATQAIMSSTDPVRTMNEILLNFPKHAPSLSSSRVSSELRESTNHWLSSGAQQVPPNSLFINGARVDLDRPTFNIFSLIGMLHKEFNSLDFLNERNLVSGMKKSIVDLARTLNEKKSRGAAGGLGNIVRVDVSKGGKSVINFLNNLEKDSLYKRFPKSVKTLLQPSWSLHALQKNLYTLIGVVDPASPSGASLLYQLNSLFQQQYPLRIGVALACDETKRLEAGEGGKSDQISSADVCRLFAETKSVAGNQVAFQFLFAVANAIQDAADTLFSTTGQMTASISQDELLKIFAETIARAKKTWTQTQKYKADGQAVLTKEDHTEFLTNSSVYLRTRGLTSNSFVLNGIIRNTIDVSSELMQLLGREQYILSLMVRKGQITDSTKSIYNALMDDSVTYSRYHPVIDETTSRYLDPKNLFISELMKKLPLLTNSNSNDQQDLRSECSTGQVMQDAPVGLFNTTMIYFPLTSSGLETALSALQWLKSTRTNGGAGGSDGAGEGEGAHVCRVDQTSSQFTHALGLIPTLPLQHHNSGVTDRFTFLSSLLLKSCLTQTQFCGETELDLVTDLLELFLLDTETPIDQTIQQLKGLYPLHPILQSFPDHWLSSESDSQAASELERLGFKSISEGISRLEDDTIVIYNGRIFQIASTEKPYLDLDFELIHDIEQSRLNQKLAVILSTTSTSAAEGSSRLNGYDFVTLASFCGTYASSSGSRVSVETVLEEMEQRGYQMNNILRVHSDQDQDQDQEGDESGAGDVSLVYVFDPLSQSGQRAAALIQYVQQELKLPQLIVLTPDTRITEFPLQNFYRFVAGGTGFAQFKQLPKQHTLTIRMDPPEAWNVQSYRSVQDIDNLKCSSHRCGDVSGSEMTSVSYLVKNLLIAGQCFEGMQSGNPSPPNGLQLVLGKASSASHVAPSSSSDDRAVATVTHFSDTLVMQNLGYFQLQANPGLWELSLAEGRAQTLYLLDETNDNVIRDSSASASDSASGAGAGEVSAVSIPIRSFADKVLHVTVSKRLGMEHLSLLDSEDNPSASSVSASEGKGSMWNSISGMFGLNGKAVTPTGSKESDDRIHVFSLATGQVYERLLRIMMLSVVKRTTAPIKFWLFEYYLSPSFKATVTAMQQIYGFEVGYVMYKWPEWLTQQTEKQRIIWGYKILFLDVLFPLDVKKVIYVDADQVVRADLKELWEMDLHGKPYAYTPFCDTREETL
jgi:hypothetical protein